MGNLEFGNTLSRVMALDIRSSVGEEEEFPFESLQFSGLGSEVDSNIF
jgi:hypothetical protein